MILQAAATVWNKWPLGVMRMFSNLKAIINIDDHWYGLCQDRTKWTKLHNVQVYVKCLMLRLENRTPVLEILSRKEFPEKLFRKLLPIVETIACH